MTNKTGLEKLNEWYVKQDGVSIQLFIDKAREFLAAEQSQTPKPAANADMMDEIRDLCRKYEMVQVDSIYKILSKYHPVKANDDGGLVDEIKEYLSGIRRSDGAIDIRDGITDIISRHASSKDGKGE